MPASQTESLGKTTNAAMSGARPSRAGRKRLGPPRGYDCVPPYKLGAVQLHKAILDETARAILRTPDRQNAFLEIDVIIVEPESLVHAQPRDSDQSE
jgi:hypothetical protein